jgi:hypothetical protein
MNDESFDVDDLDGDDSEPDLDVHGVSQLLGTPLPQTQETQGFNRLLV